MEGRGETREQGKKRRSEEGEKKERGYFKQEKGVQESKETKRKGREDGGGDTAETKGKEQIQWRIGPKRGQRRGKGGLREEKGKKK